MESFGKILIVDDSPSCLRSLEKIVTKIGVSEIQKAMGVVSALEKLEKECEEYWIVLSDIKMDSTTDKYSNYGGLELLEKIKAQWPWMHVIMITSFPADNIDIEAFILGAYDCIPRNERAELKGINDWERYLEDRLKILLQTEMRRRNSRNESR